MRPLRSRSFTFRNNTSENVRTGDNMTVPIIEKPFQIYAGDPWLVMLVLKERDENGVDTPIDLTDQIVLAQWRVRADMRQFIDMKITINDAINGEIFLEFSGEQTANMNSFGTFDVSVDGYTVVRGNTEWVKDVTR